VPIGVWYVDEFDLFTDGSRLHLSCFVLEFDWIVAVVFRRVFSYVFEAVMTALFVCMRNVVSDASDLYDHRGFEYCIVCIIWGHLSRTPI